MSKIINVQVPGGRIVQFANHDGRGTAAKNYAKCWGGKVLNPEALAANAAIDGIAASSKMPVRSPGLCALLRLDPTVAFNDEIAAAWQANGCKASPLNRDAVVQALVNYTRGRNGCSTDEALTFLRDRHPALFPEALKATAGTSGANERYSGNFVNEVEVLAIGPTMKYA